MQSIDGKDENSFPCSEDTAVEWPLTARSS
jgi:hypothetical protein